MKRGLTLCVVFGLAGCRTGETEVTEHRDITPSPAAEAGNVGFSIYNGSADSTTYDNSIFLLTGINESGARVAPLGTAANILYDRCLLTAGHVVNNSTPMVAWQGQTITGSSKGQAFQTRFVRDTANGVDLAIVWLQGRNGTSDIVDYDPLPMVDDIGLSHRALEIPGDPARTSTGSPKSVVFYGYGATGAGTTGQGVRRKGAGNARWYSIGTMESPAEDTGSVYQFEPAQLTGATGAQRACGGDSGGPSLYDGELFAVMKGTTEAACDATGLMIATGLDKHATAPTRSNWDWVQYYAKKLCAKSVDVQKTGPGTIQGSVTPTPSGGFLSSDADLDGTIQCALDVSTGSAPSGWWDCLQLVHDAETLTLVAQPDSNGTFVNWTTGNGGGGCPCHASTNPSCVLPFASVGYYSSTSSFDGTRCVANFTFKSPGWPYP
jgi:hypothetical protein